MMYSFSRLCFRLGGRGSSMSWWKGSEVFVDLLEWLCGDPQVGIIQGNGILHPDFLIHLEHNLHHPGPPGPPGISWLDTPSSSSSTCGCEESLLRLYVKLAPSLSQPTSICSPLRSLISNMKFFFPQGRRPKINTRAQWPPRAPWAWGAIRIARNAGASGDQLET